MHGSFLLVLILMAFSKIGLSKLNDNIFPFQNTSLSWDERIDDLVSRLMVDEIIDQLSYGGYGDNGPAPAISRLGIGSYIWYGECLRGFVC